MLCHVSSISEWWHIFLKSLELVLEISMATKDHKSRMTKKRIIWGSNIIKCPFYEEKNLYSSFLPPHTQHVERDVSTQCMQWAFMPDILCLGERAWRREEHGEREEHGANKGNIRSDPFKPKRQPRAFHVSLVRIHSYHLEYKYKCWSVSVFVETQIQGKEHEVTGQQYARSIKGSHVPLLSSFIHPSPRSALSVRCQMGAWGHEGRSHPSHNPVSYCRMLKVVKKRFKDCRRQRQELWRRNPLLRKKHLELWMKTIIVKTTRLWMKIIIVKTTRLLHNIILTHVGLLVAGSLWRFSIAVAPFSLFTICE